MSKTGLTATQKPKQGSQIYLSFSRSAGSSGRWTPQPPNSGGVVNSSLPDAPAAAPSQHFQPQRKLWSHAEGGRRTANTWAAAAGESKHGVRFLVSKRLNCTLNGLCVCLKVYELTLNYTQHWDHNVVTAAMELLQQMFRTPPPELLHMLITAGSIPHATVFRQDTESRARSGSILELIGNLVNQLGQVV